MSTQKLQATNVKSIDTLFEQTDDEYVESFVERFWSKVEKDSGCWNWTASTKYGYGQVVFSPTGEFHVLQAHRVAKYLDEREDLTDVQCNHTCDNRECVNPDHMYLGTAQENVQDAVERSGMNKGTSNGQAALTAGEVISIRKHYESGKGTYGSIGDKYGVCENTVGKIVRGQRYTEVGGPIKGDDY